MKRFAKYIGLLLIIVIAGGGTFAAYEWNADKPLRFRSLLDREVVKLAFEDPETLTSLGFLESLGIKDHNAHLSDASLANDQLMMAKAMEIKALIEAYSDSELSENDLLSKRIALYLLDYLEAAAPYQYHNYPANQLFGIQSAFPSFMQAQHQVHDLEDAENYLHRMTELPRKFNQYMEGLTLREERNILPPRFVVQRVLDEMNAFVATPPTENILYTALEEKLSSASEISDEQKSDLLARAVDLIETDVYPAYDTFINYFNRVIDKTNSDDGIWHLPQGDEVYALALQFFTTTDYTADEIHEIGLREVDRIQAEILAILAAEGYDTSVGFTAAMEVLSANPDFYYEDSDAGRAQILEDYQIILDEIDAGIDSAFNIRPIAGMEVVRIPEFKEKTSPGAYYQQPAIDGSRPGRFFANLYDIKATPKFGMRTLAYHEGIPGHHFQIAIAMELEGMPLIRRMSPFTAYTEGWALYAEQVAWEQGFQNDPYDNIGRLVAELFRAVRLVVDTGIHHQRWTREEAIDYMLSNTGMAESDVVSEIERYIVMPGQATAYKIGMMKILELRSKAQNALGDRFDIRDFHDVVLKNGAVPLAILEELVDQYIAERSAQ